MKFEDDAAVKYQEDPHFKQAVDLFYNLVASSQYTLHELRQALTHAAIRYETQHARPSLVFGKELPE